jgi:hypothetical protein
VNARPLACPRVQQGDVRLVLTIAAACLGGSALITLLLCAPHVL